MDPMSSPCTQNGAGNAVCCDEIDCLPYCRKERPCRIQGVCPYNNPAVAAGRSQLSSAGESSIRPRAGCSCRNNSVAGRDVKRRGKRLSFGTLKPSWFVGKKPAIPAAVTSSLSLPAAGRIRSNKGDQFSRSYSSPCAINYKLERRSGAARHSDASGDNTIRIDSTIFSCMVALSLLAIFILLFLVYVRLTSA